MARHKRQADGADAFGRPGVNGTTLRLAVTDRCNLRCRYCMPARPSPRSAAATRTPSRDTRISTSNLIDMVQWLTGETGIDRIRLTGGEPLLRPDIVELVAALSRIDGIEEVSATTNGGRLPRLAADLRSAGLRRVNISIDSLDAGRYQALTRGGRLDRALDGLSAAMAVGLEPIKINSVLLAGTWRHEVPALLDLTASTGIEVRFIELMRTGTEARWAFQEHIDADKVQRWLARQSEMLPVTAPSTGPARRARMLWAGRPVTVGWITPVSHRFCGSCNRLRLDVGGRLRRCLMDPNALPLADLVRRPDQAEARGALAEYLRGKHAPLSMESALPMIAVGG